MENLKLSKSLRRGKPADLLSDRDAISHAGVWLWWSLAVPSPAASWIHESRAFCQSSQSLTRFPVGIHALWYTPVYEQRQWFTSHTKRHYFKEVPNHHRPWDLCSFLWKGADVLCCAAGLEQTWRQKSQIVLVTARQTHSSGKRSCDLWPLHLYDQQKFIHAFFWGWVNKTQQDLMICRHKQCGVNQ